MQNFIINQNQQSNGDHEVHNKSTGCPHMPLLHNQIDLGMHATCHEAVAAAKRQWQNHRINGCYYCSYSCHTS